MSYRHMSWASRADRLLSATGPVSDRQYPIRIGVGATGTLGARFGTRREKLQLPGQGDGACAAMLENDG